MADVTELRLAFTVEDFDQALAFYRDALGLEQLADWSSDAGRVVALNAGRAVLELLDQAQAELVDATEAGRRVSGTVRFALRVADSEAMARRLAGAGAVPVAPPVLTPWGDRNARVEAPDGMQLTLFTRASPYPTNASPARQASGREAVDPLRYHPDDHPGQLVRLRRRVLAQVLLRQLPGEAACRGPRSPRRCRGSRPTGTGGRCRIRSG